MPKVGDQNMPGGCDKSGNVELSAHAPASAKQLKSLYGGNVKYPKVLGGCASYDITSTRQSIELAVGTSSQ